MLDELRESTDVRHSIAELVARAIEAEHGHAQRAIEALIERTEEGLAGQINERKDAAGCFLREPAATARNPCGRPKAAEELGALIRLPLRLSTEQLRQL